MLGARDFLLLRIEAKGRKALDKSRTDIHANQSRERNDIRINGRRTTTFQIKEQANESERR
jgi:hypothetical protein